jgi:peptidyl-prolyl cis-trans isomerase A (cyclophilin A)
MPLFVLVFCSACEPHNENPRVVVATSLGDIAADVYLDQAPVTATAFLKNVDDGIYNDGRAEFYRVVHMENQPDNPVRIEVVQGGVDRETGDTSVSCIPHETTAETGLTHLDGSLSMAREEPGTANTEFAICVGAQPELDYGGRRNPDGQGFAVFGRVTKGMEVVRRIQKQTETVQYLDRPVKITSIRRVGAGDD